jgi:diaminohydroxyphosphoribosylaminopyrimidine deaminase/5-amino-6-(5-phosphoribosylamino)uracil reductase
VIVDNKEIIASGHHSNFGGPHAEVKAISRCDPNRLRRSTVYVTLEPCSHFGKTPPCVDLLVRHQPKRVVIAMSDPFPAVSGRGIALLREKSIDVDVGVLETQAKHLNAPYLKLLSEKMPWVIAKWAMTLDGALATRDGDSKWISNEMSRRVVHRIRSRVDAVLVGIGTALADDPLLTARLEPNEAPLRIASRIVLDRQCRLSPDSKLVQSVGSGPVLIAVSPFAPQDNVNKLKDAGCEILVVPEEAENQSLGFVLKELGNRRFTNVLLEGGSTLLGSAFDGGWIDEVHCFIAPKIVGGHNAMRPVDGVGKALMEQAAQLSNVQIECLENDVHFHGFVDRRMN